MVLAAALAVLAAAAPGASAGTYTVHACSTPHGTPASLDGWMISTTAGSAAQASQTCGQRGGFVSLRLPPGTRVPGDSAMATFTAPPNTVIQQATLLRLFTGSANPHVFWRAFVEGAPGEECVGRGGCPGLPLAERVIPGLGRSRLAVQVFCGAIGSQCVNVPATVEGRLLRATIVLSDDAPPSFAEPPGGALVQPRAEVAGVQEVAVALRDVGGGLRDVRLEVDDRPVATEPMRGCAEPFAAPVPCPLQAGATLRLDTTTLPDGPHRVRVVATDVGGNAVAHGPVDISVRNVPVACAAGTDRALAARFTGRRRRRTRTAGYGARVRVRGQLAGAGAGVRIQPLERVARRGARETPAGPSMTTDARGRFSFRVPRGPSRTLRFAYRRGPTDTTLACSARLRLRVRAPVTLRASRRRLPARRQRARFSGRVRGGFVPRRGVRVNVQAFENRRWQTFESRRTDRRGRFRVRVPFSGRRGTFRLRAVVPTDSAYPFALGRSRTVRVRGGSR